MAAKSLLVSFLSFLLFLGLNFIVYGFDEIASEFPVQYFLQILFWGCIPFVTIGFIVLLLFNFSIERLIMQKTKNQKEKQYWLLGSVASLVPVLAFVTFDYSQRGRYFHNPGFLDILLDYVPFLILSFIALLFNRSVVWKNFRE